MKKRSIYKIVSVVDFIVLLLIGRYEWIHHNDVDVVIYDSWSPLASLGIVICIIVFLYCHSKITDEHTDNKR